MTPLFFFFNLCITLSGVDDCSSYDWIVIPSENMAEWYTTLGGEKKPDGVLAFFHPQLKLIVVSEIRTVEMIIHEREHIICQLTYSDPTERELCDMKVDSHISQGTRPQDTTPEPPLITEKMKYSQQFQ